MTELLQELHGCELTTAVDLELEKTLVVMRMKPPNAPGILPEEAELLEILNQARGAVAARLAAPGATDAN